MDLSKAIENLRAEKAKIEQVIAALEDLQKTSGTKTPLSAGQRRGRKFMDSKERQEVSRRMTRYWANRRKLAQAGRKPGSGAGPAA